jgi:hypothetical protein
MVAAQSSNLSELVERALTCAPARAVSGSQSAESERPPGDAPGIQHRFSASLGEVPRTSVLRRAVTLLEREAPEARNAEAHTWSANRGRRAHAHIRSDAGVLGRQHCAPVRSVERQRPHHRLRRPRSNCSVGVKSRHSVTHLSSPSPKLAVIRSHLPLPLVER